MWRSVRIFRNHHLTLPFRPLVPDAAMSVAGADLDGSLIIHGDNLHALKALLPRYAGKVDCIFIDPPYNTGNEGWSYNDNVNSVVIARGDVSAPGFIHRRASVTDLPAILAALAAGIGTAVETPILPGATV
jgi:hypothetical protein